MNAKIQNNANIVTSMNYKSSGYDDLILRGNGRVKLTDR